MVSKSHIVQLTRDSLLSKLKAIQTDFIVAQNGIAEAKKRIETIESSMAVSSGKFQALSDLGIELGLFTNADVKMGIPNVVASFVDDTSDER